MNKLNFKPSLEFFRNSIMLIAVTGIIIGVLPFFLKKQDKVDCMKLQSQANKIQNYYFTQPQINKCKAVNINLYYINQFK